MLTPQQKGGFRRSLLRWYRAHARDLPWRRTKDPYAIWLSEVLLQQTRVDQGLPYYTRFLRQFPDVQSLAAANEDAVLKAWEGLGYYSRARNLHRAAKLIVSEKAGRFPDSAEEWQRLPGVGRYTAGAIVSIAFDEASPVLDGNVIRVLTRLFDVADSIERNDVSERLWQLAAGLVPSNAPGDFNQAMMELGARVCTPRDPDCGGCPVSRQCVARELGVQSARPVRKAKAESPHRELVAAAIRKRGRYLLGKRPANGLLGGLWELPGGEVGPGESHELALRRAMRESLAIRVRVGGLVASVRHTFTHLRVTINVYVCDVEKGEPSPTTHTALKWVRKSQFCDYAFPKAHHKFLHLL